MSELHAASSATLNTNNNNNNNNNNNASEQDLILAAKRAASQLNSSSQQMHQASKSASTAPPSTQAKRSLHLSHQQLGASGALAGSGAVGALPLAESLGGGSTQNKLSPSGNQLSQAPQHQHHHHQQHHQQQQQQLSAANLYHQEGRRHFASHQQLSSSQSQAEGARAGVMSANAQLAAASKLQQQKQSTSLMVAPIGAIHGAGRRREAALDRSDSASLPSSGDSSASTSDSMFKRTKRLGSGTKWQQLLACCCCGGFSSSGSGLATTNSNGEQLNGNKSGRSNGEERARVTSLSPLGLLLWLLFLTASLLLISYFKPFGFSIFSCSFSGSNAASKQVDRFNTKNAPEFYIGITEMLQSMDMTVDPCSDFYNYACGAWTRSHSIPGDESRIDTFSVMRTDLGNKLKDLLEEEINSSDSEATIKAKTLYKSCVDETTIDKRGPEPLLALLESKFGGWPLLGPRSSSNSSSSLSGELANQEAQTNVNEISPSDWVKLMAILRTYNNEIIIGQTVGSHEQNSTLHAIRLYPAGLGLPSADYYNSSSRQFKAYEKYLLNVARLLGANNTNLVQDVADLLDFETGLANISKPFERQGGATYHRMTIAKLQKYTPAIDWDTYFRYSFPDVAINSTEQVGLYGLDFFMDIAQLINSTPNKKTVINYLLWRFVMNRVNNLGKEFADKQHEYAAEISGAKNQAPRAKVCVDYVNGNMGMAVSSLYVKKHFDSGSKQQAEIMIANIRQAFLDILHEVDWMDSETRQEAIVKAKSMLQHIGFPTWIIEPATLDQEYMHLNFTANSYFENVIQLIQSFAKESREKLRHPSERDKWTVAPSIINAHYLRTKNLMSFPAGILQPPIYHTRYPKSLNYGGIGSIIGHEITHGFDNDGRHHDYQGNQRLWWHPNTVDRFIIRSQCMVRQYDDYSVEIRGENISVSGIRTLGENIADNGGLKEAFMAYRKYEQENGPEDLFPNVNLTHHQMFFIKFAQNWCQNMTPQSMMNALKTWRHPLGKFRVIGTLSNLNEFSTAFKCPPNSQMNPSQKCKVW